RKERTYTKTDATSHPPAIARTGTHSRTTNGNRFSLFLDPPLNISTCAGLTVISLASQLWQARKYLWTQAR
ncbi:MAG TPA: hypothetical protein VKA28_00440, partial [Candidatus Bathyarchaeia archaeon]|nr:hypothetical protein [Candidatus Bathyarchaeia archaeon]